MWVLLYLFQLENVMASGRVQLWESRLVWNLEMR